MESKKCLSISLEVQKSEFKKLWWLVLSKILRKVKFALDVVPPLFISFCLLAIPSVEHSGGSLTVQCPQLLLSTQTLLNTPTALQSPPKLSNLKSKSSEFKVCDSFQYLWCICLLPLSFNIELCVIIFGNYCTEKCHFFKLFFLTFFAPIL